MDVSFAVHSDMRSHSGGAVSFGRGVFMPLSRKQRIKTGSSTEGEVVGVSDYAPNTIWLLKFLSAQGYKPKMSILYKDNESAIKLLKHGKKSSSRRIRHIDIRLFNIKDKLSQEEIEVVYCPTKKIGRGFFYQATPRVPNSGFYAVLSLVWNPCRTSIFYFQTPPP